MKEEMLIELIHKKATNQLTEAEVQELDILLKDKENQILASEIESAWEKSLVYQEDYKVDEEKGLARLKKSMQKEKILSPSPPVKVVSIQKSRRSWLQVAAAVAILVMGSWFGWNTFGGGDTAWQKVVTVDNSQELKLSDGSKIWVNSKSQFQYPAEFSKKERKVKLEGEAFFDIAKNPEKPFIIETGTMQIEVLGTSFNVRNYADEDLVEVTVRSGKVKVKTGNSTKILTKNDQLIFDKKKKKIIRLKDKGLNALSWWSGKLSFQKEKMTQVKQSIERTYGVKLKFTNSSLLDCDFTLFNYQKSKGIDNLLEVIKATFSIDELKKVGRHEYQLIGGECIHPQGN